MKKILIKNFYISIHCLLFLASGFFSSLEASSLFEQQPKRIISTSPSITEILFELGLQDRIVAVTDFCTSRMCSASIKIQPWSRSTGSLSGFPGLVI